MDSTPLTSLPNLTNLMLSLDQEVSNITALIPLIQSSLKMDRCNDALDGLTKLIERRESEIEKLVYDHYQEFIDSVDQLLAVKRGTSKLKSDVQLVNQQLQISGTELVSAKTELIHQRKVQQTLGSLIDALSSCLKVLRLANLIDIHINNRNYSVALKLLEELSQQHLPNLDQYEFAKYMESCIPSMRNLVYNSVVKDKREWILKLKKQSDITGLTMLNDVIKKQAKWRVREAKHNQVYSDVIHKTYDQRDQCLDINLLSIEKEENSIDYQSFYQCLDIHTKLDLLSKFQKDFQDERQRMATNLTESPLNLGQVNLTNFKSVLAQIVGFFKVEQELLITTQHFRRRAEVDQLWTSVTSKLVDDLSRNLEDAQNIPRPQIPNQLKSINVNMQAFGYLAKDLGLDCDKLDAFLDALASYEKHYILSITE